LIRELYLGRFYVCSRFLIETHVQVIWAGERWGGEADFSTALLTMMPLSSFGEMTFFGVC